MTDQSHEPAPLVDPFNFAHDLLARNHARSGKTAFIDDAGTLSYGELTSKVRQMAAALAGLGIRREERVLILMHDCCDWPVAFLGAMYAGIVPVAVNTLLTAEDYAYMLEHSRAQLVIVSAALLPVLSAAMAQSQHEVGQIIVSGEEVELGQGQQNMDALLHGCQQMNEPARTGQDDPGFWLYSSGSTGRPKGTVHSQANPYWTARLYGEGVLGIREDDVCFSAAKLFFAYGLGNALTFPLSVGATVLLMAGRPTPQATFERWVGGADSKSAKPTVFFGAPTGFAAMLASPDLPRQEDVSFRLVSSAGEPLPADIGQRFKAWCGVSIIDGIGSTEMLHIYLSNQPDKVRFGTTGWPVPGYAIELRNEDGAIVPDGETGDLFIKGPSSAMHYWNNRQKSLETFQGEWTRSGDKYTRNEDGSYTYAGRSDDMLKVSGIYVSPFEVEGVLVEHQAVLEAAVIGVPDADGLTKTKAYVVLVEGCSVPATELQAFVKSKLAPYKYPRSIEFIDELPKTATGKIQRFKLRQSAAE